MQQCTLSEITNTANLLPFEQSNVELVIMNSKKLHAKGLISRFHPQFTPTLPDVLDEMKKGVFVLTCPQLEMDFLYTCENGGVGFFGRQKRVFKVFGGVFEDDDFSPSTTFKSFGIAVTSINNVFRGRGLLTGMA